MSSKSVSGASFIRPHRKDVYTLPFPPTNREQTVETSQIPLHDPLTIQAVMLNGRPLKVNALDSNRTECAGELAILTSEQSVHPTNEDESFRVADGVYAGWAILAARKPNSNDVSLNPSLGAKTELLRLKDVNAIESLISFTPKEDLEPDPAKRYDIIQLDKFLQLICDVAENQSKEGILRFILHDRCGNEISCRNFRPYQFRELRRWVLDGFDTYQTPRFDWLLRAPTRLGDHSETKPLNTLAEPVSGKQKPEIIIHSSDGDSPLITHTDKSCPKNHKTAWYPIPGLPVFTEDGESITTYNEIKEG